MLKLLYILPFITFAQSDIIWHDLTNDLNNGKGGWGIGNACGEDFFLNAVIKEDFDMKGDDLQILNSHVIFERHVLNQGNIIYLCDNSVLEILGGVLSNPEVEKESFKIYPNPAINEINIKGIEVSELELFDMTGRKLKDFKTFGTSHKIIINDLQSGVYILRINNSITHKIIKI